ncbi:GntR family transcriptional regulator [Roseomonas terrae]|jgi:GntR family carbon starvation induced transcriptional regulator|uniref:GntR family transcriptional regulator n=1 Tax=Neoroseomonas terrae TaxID=424799 RepID=A0ABS5EIY4_9PROT|nr:GntR family transcriptional regulator [Neoroseomonas terrae]MBR0650963.1 GntR family transcriptional regulator [Neoroseomonas terrae]
METEPATAVEAATHRLREEIVAGSLPAEARLRLRDLTARFGYGATPLREALSRLAAEGFVLFEGQKGFSVPPVTRTHLLDITQSRQFVEPEALRLAMEHGDAAWEDEIVASVSLMRREIERRRADPDWLDIYEAKHHRLHRALIAACPLVALRAFCDELYMQTTRYRRLMKSAMEDWPRSSAAHQSLADAVLARDPAALQGMRDHIGTTSTRVLAMLGETPAP